jgi:hypothetical protein
MVKNCASLWSFTEEHNMMHGQQNVKFRQPYLRMPRGTEGNKETLLFISQNIFCQGFLHERQNLNENNDM